MKIEYGDYKTISDKLTLGLYSMANRLKAHHLQLRQKLYVKNNNIELNWIPKKQLDIYCIGELFRGQKIPLLAQRIENIFGNRQGVVNAFLIGKRLVILTYILKNGLI